MGTREILAGAVGVVMTGGVALGGAAPGDILNIMGELHGDWSLQTAPAFIPGTQGGHFGLDTLLVSEFVPGTVEDATGAPRPAEPWADLWIKVQRVAGSAAPNTEPAMIAVDKDVLNGTPLRWTDFHMEIGVGIGDGFMPMEGLAFKRDPAPSEESMPPKFPEPMFGDFEQSLWWDVKFGDDGVFPGVLPGEVARFWLGMTIPADKFEPVAGTNLEEAMITVRQHWTPSPGAAGVLGLAGLALVRRRRG